MSDCQRKGTSAKGKVKLQWTGKILKGKVRLPKDRLIYQRKRKRKTKGTEFDISNLDYWI